MVVKIDGLTDAEERQLKELARLQKKSRNEYLLDHVRLLLLQPEVKIIESRYEVLFDRMAQLTEMNTLAFRALKNELTEWGVPISISEERAHGED
ncbi:hypothetical protein HCJ57_15780 [Listeria booriae]|uniref:hypothetical protein n=1 Tax=Listeria booriae TaxID=1552123 RepID=UPI00162828B9|nr:hypothetical protein [Listeria booriae]MBC1235484.1 hypothetical protein [Listeria booriae]MBC1248196.1 hypothetical protein [Listeria booriae]MBC1274316.1 hypothetical protein [Listeria booriae]MBC2057986.1 hypothetical protein [Listeria booriae]